MADGEGRNLVPEQAIHAGNLLEDIHDFVRNGADHLALGIVGFFREVVDVGDTDGILLQEGGHLVRFLGRIGFLLFDSALLEARDYVSLLSCLIRHFRNRLGRGNWLCRSSILCSILRGIL